ncbi:diguanylate cyclase [Methylophaga frappieri]|uniref:diguanylate cyclase n=1 Tax=Methylophaga frappieri (strain ATCC BAA-2434 / DSM 25690 / JAM7) TaxID=754477 RepID=I1YFP2_METFJ|nr:sensor domain-containing diguanylate cyclase [Methylophaga frappieri]AFJ01735.1 diguanylate cyclase [Methylophaga frappieri]
MTGHDLSSEVARQSIDATATDAVRIQRHGCLLRCDATLSLVLQVSENISQILGIDVSTALASMPRDVLGGKLHERLLTSLKTQPRLHAPMVIDRQIAGQYQRFYVMAYRSDSDIVVEYEGIPRAGEHSLLPEINEWLGRLAVTKDISTLLQTLTQGVQTITGFDRVMLCEFDEQAHRIVVAESCRYPDKRVLGYHFPESAIPLTVRQRYQKNSLTSVPNVNAKPVSLIPTSANDMVSLDLTPGFLQALSEVESNQLQNTGIWAKLSVAIHSHTGLWGVLVCHHFDHLELSPAERDAAYSLVQMAAQRLFLLQTLDDARFMQAVMDSRELLSAERGFISDPEMLIEAHGDSWLELFSLSGMALMYENKITCHGHALTKSEVDILVDWLADTQPSATIWHCYQLAATDFATMVDSRDIAGVLAIKLPTAAGKVGWVLLFRRAEPYQHYWLAKQSQLANLQHGQLKKISTSPSEIWQQTVVDCAPHWQPREQKAALELAEDLTIALSVHAITNLNQQMQRANAQLQEIAHTDSLTGVWNRYKIEQAIDAELSAAERYGRACSVLLFDIDHFKRVNDNFGHDIGDRVLQRLATEIEAQLRASDYLGRWGGEEFIVLVSNNGVDEAAMLAERLRSHIASIMFNDVGQVTISTGVTQWRTGESRRSMLERADKAMYAAKQSGRNAVKTAT